jgi:hypothetical protein
MSGWIYLGIFGFVLVICAWSFYADDESFDMDGVAASLLAAGIVTGVVFLLAGEPDVSDGSNGRGSSRWATPSRAQLETGQYAGSPENSAPTDLNGDGFYGTADKAGVNDPGIDDDYNGSIDEFGERAP